MDITLKVIQIIFSQFGFDAHRVGREFFLKRNGTAYFKRSEQVADLMLRDYLKYLLNSLKINVVLDVGANKGQYAMLLRQCGYASTIISFEPLRELYEHLVEISSEDDRWFVYPYACGSFEATSEINIMDTTEYSSLLEPSQYGLQRDERIAVTRSESVQVKRLDSLLPDLLKGIDKPRLYIKMDTQGYDLNVFEGLGSFMNTSVLALQSEMSALPLYENMPSMSYALDLYEKSGFKAANIFPVAYDATNASVVEYDCIMIHGSQSDFFQRTLR